VAAVCFDATGLIIATASIDGHTINVFEVLPRHPGGPPAAYMKLYQLSRGITNSIIQDLSFSSDNSWCACVTARGTVHLWCLDAPDSAFSSVRKLYPSLDPVQRTALPDEAVQMTATVRIRPAAHSSAATPPNPAEGANIPEPNKSMSLAFTPVSLLDTTQSTNQSSSSKRVAVVSAGPTGGLSRFLLSPAWQTNADTAARELAVEPETVGCWALGRAKDAPVMTTAPAVPEAGAAAEGSSWLSQLEVCTFAAERLPLWADPNVKFKGFSEGDHKLASTICVPWAAAAPHSGGGDVVGALTERMSNAMYGMMSMMGSATPATPEGTAPQAAVRRHSSCSEANDYNSADEEGLNHFEECQETNDHEAETVSPSQAQQPINEAQNDTQEDAESSQDADIEVTPVVEEEIEKKHEPPVSKKKKKKHK